MLNPKFHDNDKNKRGEEYKLDEKQKALAEQYEAAVNLLIQHGIPAKFRRFWVKAADEPVGYISLES